MTHNLNPRRHDRPQVLLFDSINWVQDWSYDEEIEMLSALGVDVVIPDDRGARDRELGNADVVVVSSIDRVESSHIARLTRCVGILCYSAGMDAVDVAAANQAGIEVSNIRAGTADVADHAMALLLAAWRRLPVMTRAVAEHRWDLDDNSELRTMPRIEGKTLGIFGAGAIGRAVAVRARGFGLSTIATYRRPEAADRDLPHVPLEQLFAESHAVVLTASLTPTTSGIINEAVLSRSRPGLILVNVGRGGLVVEADLAAALEAGTVAWAALDVRDPEPPDPDDDLLGGHLNVIQTPHVAGVSAEALSSLHRLAAEGIESLLRNGGRL
jgi:phosphoglycerate dehydrogenase-like enzyme